jgi:diguanylate cyclase (GGDEF)-like protein
MGLCFWRLRQEFYLGGIVCGCSLLCFAAWSSRLVLNPVHADIFNRYVFASIPLFGAIAIVIHVFLRMEHRISYDPLLHIFNRDYCSKIISEQANIITATPFGIAMVDIDHFKNVNDTYGHQAGDAVLYAVAQSVKHSAGVEGIACRYGGEELVIFFPQMSSKEVTVVAEKIRVAIERIKTKSGKKTITVTVSIGVSHRDIPEQSIVDVIQAADKALYAAKNGGRNQVKSLRCSNTNSAKK